MRLLIFVPLLCATLAAAAEMTLTLPEGTLATAAVATQRGAKPSRDLRGQIADDTIRFAGLQQDVTYDLRITLKDGLELRGADMRWYTMETADPEAAALSDDDRSEIRELCGVPSFYDRVQILKLQGSHERATALVQLVRDRDFHAGKGEIIWRAEVWYFRFQAGGWEKVSQQALVLDRQRFPTRAAYESAVLPVRFVPALGGVRLADDAPTHLALTTADIRAAISAPTTAPAAR